MSNVVIVGAGFAGLAAARVLAPKHTVIVVDKGRGIGGRAATRRIDEATLDHGAQFITTHTAEFAEEVQHWITAGVAAPWFHGQVGPHGVTGSDGHVRYRGTPTMNSIPRHLAAGLDVRTSTTVTALHTENDRWRVQFDDDVLTADAVMLTSPVPQSLALLDAGGVVLDTDDRTALEAVRYDPCIAVLAVYDSPVELPEPGALRLTDSPIDWMAEHVRKGVSARPAVTVHTTASFSEAHWTDSNDDTVAAVLGAAPFLHARAAVATQVHRWRYARPSVLHPAPCLHATNLPPLLFAGDAFDGAKVEGAFLSGRRAAEQLLTLI
jgi:predicted NAD/FAD-dependent oxidoreductase